MTKQDRQKLAQALALLLAGKTKEAYELARQIKNGKEEV
tara:strand:+ start:219 stop:335 length:117 start_codon:yes stop_codon:yes gene_type:complete